MYYPIIDKLKEIMTDITSVKEKEPLIIVGTMESPTGGSWAGNWIDIVNAFSNNKPVYFKIQTGTNTGFIPVITLENISAESSILYINNVMVYGKLNKSGNFSLVPIFQ